MLGQVFSLWDNACTTVFSWTCRDAKAVHARMLCPPFAVQHDRNLLSAHNSNLISTLICRLLLGRHQAYGCMNELGPMAALLRRQWAEGTPAPDLHTCNAALGACSRVGALDQALQIKVLLPLCLALRAVHMSSIGSVLESC